MEKYNQIMNKKRMTVDEAIDIVDGMYQDRMKQIEKNNTIYVDRLDNIKFTNLEFASVILLREVQSLRRKLKNSVSKNKIENKIEYLEIRKAECDDIESKVRLDVKINAYKELLEDK